MLRTRMVDKKNTDEKAVIQVGCAIIEHRGKVLIAQRMPGSALGGFWEFPGGKREPGETMEECLTREVAEELAVCIRPRLHVRTTYHTYVDRDLELFFYICDWVWGQPVPHEAIACRWLPFEELDRYTFPPADRDILNELKLKRLFYFGRS